MGQTISARFSALGGSPLVLSKAPSICDGLEEDVSEPIDVEDDLFLSAASSIMENTPSSSVTATSKVQDSVPYEKVVVLLIHWADERDQAWREMKHIKLLFSRFNYEIRILNLPSVEPAR